MKAHQGQLRKSGEPYLEHPPLFGLVAGGYVLARGVPDMYGVTIPVMRELALMLGAASIYLVYLLASSLYGSPVGLASAFVYAIIPTVVIGSRILQNENFFIPLFLSILYALKKYLDTSRRGYLVIASVLSGLAALAKVPWIAATFSGVLILLYRRKYRAAAWYAGVSLLLFSLFLLYGIAWDKDLFVSLWRLQLNRYDMVFDSVFALVREPYLVDRYYTDGWIYAGWLAFFVLLTRNIRRHFILVFGWLGYLLMYIMAIPNEPGHGWYRYPFYPFLAIALAQYLYEHGRNYLLTPLVLLGIALSLLQHTWGQMLGFSYAAYRVVIVWFGVSALPVWFPGRTAEKFVKWNTVLQVVALILLSFWSILLYNEL